MLKQMLPVTVEELNMQQSLRVPSTLNVNITLKKSAFEDIPTEKKLKREVSLPNGVENWNISNYDSYLNFDDVIGNDFDVSGSSPGDRIVPEGDPRVRCASISSVSSFAEATFHNFGVKTINTHMDSGSTCISSDHSYFSTGSTLQKGLDILDPEETYQNLDIFLREVPEIKTTESLPAPFSPLPSTSSEELFELTVQETSRSFSSEDSFESTSFESSSRTSKRPLETISEDDVFLSKQTKSEITETFGTHHYHEIRRKNNIASKNCRKTRKEKQKDMEQKVTELEQEKEHLKVQVQVLEELIQAHKQCLLNAIAQKR